MHTVSACVSSEYYCEATKALKICCQPVNYIVSSVLYKQVCCIKISNVNELKRRINSEWVDLHHAVIERAVDE